MPSHPLGKRPLPNIKNKSFLPQLHTIPLGPGPGNQRGKRKKIMHPFIFFPSFPNLSTVYSTKWKLLISGFTLTTYRMIRSTYFQIYGGLQIAQLGLK